MGVECGQFGSPLGVRGGQVTAQCEQFALDGLQGRAEGLRRIVGGDFAYPGVELINGAVGFNPKVVFANPCTAKQARAAVVSCPRINAHAASYNGGAAALPPRRTFGIVMAEDKQDTKQKRYDAAYMRMAREWALLSHCERKQVGALIVKDQMIIADGYNGTPSGFPNVCEAEDGTTHWYVLHAEANAITKLAKSNNSAEGATLYITLSPCRDCAKLIHQAGIVRVVYADAYKDSSGLAFLNQAGVEIVHLSE